MWTERGSDDWRSPGAGERQLERDGAWQGVSLGIQVQGVGGEGGAQRAFCRGANVLRFHFWLMVILESAETTKCQQGDASLCLPSSTRERGKAGKHHAHDILCSAGGRQAGASPWWSWESCMLKSQCGSSGTWLPVIHFPGGGGKGKPGWQNIPGRFLPRPQISTRISSTRPRVLNFEPTLESPHTV